MKMLNKPLYCCLLRQSGKIYIQSQKSGQVIGFETEEEAVSFWERGYQSAFDRGLCGATGAMISMIRCDPRVVYFKTQKEMLETLFEAPPFQNCCFSLGDIYGILCQKNVEEIYNQGIIPKLLKEG